MSGPAQGGNEPDRPRAERLEEAVMYTERATEELHRAMLDLAERLRRVADRLDRLESRLDGLSAEPLDSDRAPPEPPPHSARPEDRLDRGSETDRFSDQD